MHSSVAFGACLSQSSHLELDIIIGSKKTSSKALVADLFDPLHQNLVCCRHWFVRLKSFFQAVELLQKNLRKTITERLVVIAYSPDLSKPLCCIYFR